MGSTYVNFTVKGAAPKAVAEAMAGRAAFVTPEHQGAVVVFDEESDTLDPVAITRVGSMLSRRLGCPVLAVLNHDDAVLQYQLFVKGRIHDSYESDPSYFEEAEEDGGDLDEREDEDEDEEEDDEDGDDAARPEGGDAELLIRVFGAGRVQDLEQILGHSDDAEAYPLAIDRHLDLVKALGLPQYAVGYGYEAIAGGNLPDDLDRALLIETA